MIVPSKKLPKAAIYVIGAFIFGLIYAWLKQGLGEGLGVALSLIYVVALRLIAERIGK